MNAMLKRILALTMTLCMVFSLCPVSAFAEGEPPVETVCEHSYEATETVDATCTVAGGTRYDCSLCDDYYVEPAAELGHDYAANVTAEPTCVDAGTKTLTCIRCGDSYDEEVAALGHSGTMAVINEAKCNEAGQQGYECAVCGEPVTEEIAAPGHDYQLDETAAVAPTCVEAGSQTYKCTVCGDTYGEPVAALGHTGTMVVTTEPTCTTVGQQALNCTVCGEPVTEEIAALGHSYAEGACSVCGEADPVAVLVARVNTMIADLPTEISTKEQAEAVEASLEEINKIVEADSFPADEYQKLDWDKIVAVEDALAVFWDMENNKVALAEADGWYWKDNTLYIKDGKITKAQLYAALDEKYDQGEYSSFKFDNADHNNWMTNGTEVKSDSTGDATVEEGTGYAKSRGKYGYSSGGDKWSFTVKYYYDITLNKVGEGTINLPTGAQRVYTDTVLTATPDNTTDSLVAITDPDGVVSGNKDSGWKFSKSGKVTVTFTNEYGNFTASDDVKASITIDGETISSDVYAAGDHEISIAPDWTNGYYVKSLKIGTTEYTLTEQDFASGVCTVNYRLAHQETAEIVVEIAERVLAGNTKVTLAVNAYGAGTAKANGLKTKVLDAVLGKGSYDASEYTVQLAHREILGVDRTAIESSTENGINSYIDMEANETFYVIWKGTNRYPERNLTVTGFITESRKAAKLSLPVTEYEANNLDDLKKQITEAVVAKDESGYALKDNWGNALTPTVTIAETTELPMGVNGTYNVTVAVADGQNHLNADESYTVSATRKAYTVTWDSATDTEDTTSTVYYDVAPVAPATAPNKAQTPESNYAFKGWQAPAAEDGTAGTVYVADENDNYGFPVVTGDITYTATYTATTRSYDIIWDVDGDEGEAATVTTSALYGTDPTKAADVPTPATIINKSFAGWVVTSGTVNDGNIVGDTNYKATYSDDILYEVVFMDGTTVYRTDYLNKTQADNNSSKLYATAASSPDKENDNRLFRYWSASVNGEAFAFTTTEITGKTTLYAVWADDYNNNDVDDAAETAVVTVNVTGEGTVELSSELADVEKNADGTWTVLYDSKDETSKVITVKATPTDIDGTDGEADYVSALTFNGSAVAGAAYNDKYACTGTITVGTTNSVTATFGKASIAIINPIKDVAFNPYKSGYSYTSEYSSYIDETAAAIETAILGSDKESSYIQVYVESLKTYTNLNNYVALQVLNPTTENIKVVESGSDSVPELSKIVKVKLYDERKDYTVAHNKTDSYEVDALDAAFEASVKANVTVNNVAAGDDVEVKLADSAQIPADGQTGNVTLNVKVPATVDYKGYDKSLTVSVKNLDYESEITAPNQENYTVSIGNAVIDQTNGVSKSTGDYTVTVAPADGGYYIESVSVNGNPADGKWINGNYKFALDLENGATESSSYEIKAVTGWRGIVGTEEAADAEYLVTLTDEITDVDALKQAVYDKVIDKTKTSYAPATSTYDLSGVEDLSEGLRNVTITFVGTVSGTETTTVQYPTVEKTFKVNVSRDRGDITVPTVEDVTVIENTDEVINAVIDAFLAKNNNLTTEDIEVAFKADTDSAVVSQGQEKTYTVTVSVEQTETTNAYSGDVTVKAIGKVEPAVINYVNSGVGVMQDVNGNELGAQIPNEEEGVTYGSPVFTNGKEVELAIKLVPGDKQHAEKIVVGNAENDADAVTYDRELMTHETDSNKSTFALKVKDGFGLALGTEVNYWVTAYYADNSIIVENIDAKTLKYYGQTTDELNKTVLETLKPVYAPAEMEDYAEVYYLARPADGDYTYTIALELPFVGTQKFTVNVPVGELWLNIGEEFPTDYTEPTQDDISNMVEEVLSNHSISELAGMSTAELKDLFKNELMADYGKFYTYFGAHQFGKNETEFVKIETADKENDKCPYGIVSSDVYELALVDNRIETSISFNNNITVTYGSDIRAALNASVVAGGAVVGEVVFKSTVDGLPASDEPYTIKMEFPGNETYKHCSAEATVTVTKATVDVFVDNRLIKWEENLSYAMPVGSDPAGVDVITFIAGVNASELDYNGGVQGFNGEVQLFIPGGITELLEAAGINLSASVSIDELRNVLLSIADALGFVNSENEIVNTLLNLLNELPTDVADLRITIGGDLPTDIGVYMVGAVSADANYNTDFGTGLVVIYPDGFKADIQWKIEDANGFYTIGALQKNYDLSAEVVKVYEGTMAGAEEALTHVFIGVDMNGNPVLTRDQKELTLGAYTQIAYFANIGNQMYYAEPIVRPIVVVSDLVDVKFEDANENNVRVFEWDDTEHSMVAHAYDSRSGEELTAGTITYKYVGLETDGEAYTSSTGATRPGVYTVIATYTEGDNLERVGMAVGEMIILPREATIDVQNAMGIYGKDTIALDSLITKDPVDAKQITIVAGIANVGDFSENGLAAVEGQVLVDLPDRVMNALAAITDKTEFSGGDFKALLAPLAAALEATGMDISSITALEQQLRDLPGTVTVKVTDLSGHEFKEMGAWVVIGGIMDNDYYGMPDMGLVVIRPEVTEYELGWNYNDSNGIITRPIIEDETVDLLAFAQNEEGKDADVTAQIKYIVLGIDDKGNTVSLRGDNSDETFVEKMRALPNGIYTQMAYIETELSADMPVAAPIVRQFILTPQNVTVDAPDVVVSYGSDFKYEDYITVSGATGFEFNKENLTIKYVGFNAIDDGYYREVAPTNAGIYAVLAQYKTVDENGEIEYFGFDVGTLVIKPADIDYDVKNVEYTYDGNAHEPQIDREAGIHDIVFIVDTQNASINVIAPSLGQDQDPNYNWDGDIHVQYWLEEMNKLLAELGTDKDTVVSKLETLLAEFESLTGFNYVESDALAELKAVLADVDSDKLTLNAGYPVGDPDKECKYNVYAIAFKDTNHMIEISEGTITIVPEVKGYPIRFVDTDNTALIKEGAVINIGTLTETIEFTLDENCEALLEDEAVKEAWINNGVKEIIVMHEYGVMKDEVLTNLDTTADYSYNQTSTGIYVWEVTWSAENNEFQAKRVKALDNSMEFGGGSVWLTSYGASGIRYFYKYDEAAAKQAWTDLGYTFVEHGTVVDWKENGHDPALREGEHRGENSSYGKAMFGMFQNSVYPLNAEYVPKELLISFYTLLKDAAGNEVVVYSGVVNRSVGYISWQNRDVYNGTVYDSYVERLIGQAGDKLSEYEATLNG